MDSNHRTRKRADLQSAAVGHLATCPFDSDLWSMILDLNLNPHPAIQNHLSHLSESNQRPTDYKSVALPAELKWHFTFKCPPLVQATAE